jgi:hypothetical protein
MTRKKIQALGLLLIAVLALGALGASGVWAEEEEEQKGIPKRFQAEKAPAIITGVQQEITTSFTTTKGQIVCNETHYAGTMTNAEEKELTITPTYSGECKALGLPAHVKLNGCQYLFTLEAGRVQTPGAGTHTQSPTHIKCPAGNSIVVEVTIEGATFCTIKVPPQTPTKSKTDLKNLGLGKTREVLFTSTIEELHYEVTGGGGLCGQTGKTLTDGKIDSVMTVAAYEDTGGKKGSQVGFKIYGDDAP